MIIVRQRLVGCLTDMNKRREKPIKMQLLYLYFIKRECNNTQFISCTEFASEKGASVLKIIL